MAPLLTFKVRLGGDQVSEEPSGGFFVWASLPKSCPIGASELVKLAEQEHGVLVLAGPRCFPATDDSYSNGTTRADAAALERFFFFFFFLFSPS